MPFFFIWWIWMRNGDAYHLLMASHITWGLEMETSTEENARKSPVFYTRSYTSADTQMGLFAAERSSTCPHYELKARRDICRVI